MKKYFLTLALMLPMVAMAQHWTTKTLQEQLTEALVFVQVNINGVEANGNSGLELAAFIGDECRADATAPMAASGTTTYVERYILRVVTDLNTESNATIKFRAFYQNVEYEFTRTITYTVDDSGEATYGSPSEPLVLNLDAVTGVTLPKTINISQPASAFPYTEDLTSQITYTYNTADGAPYTPKGESKLLSVPVYSWNVGNYVNQLSFDGNKLTVGPAKEASYDIGLTVSIGEGSPAAGPTTFRASTVIVVQIAKVPVTSITCSISSTEFYAWEDFYAFMQDKVTVLPAEASDKSYYLDGGDDLSDGMFVKGGQYTVTIVPNDEDYKGERPTVTVTVFERPTGITSRVLQDGITLGLGENVYETIANTTTYSWMGTEPAAAYAKKELQYKAGSEGYISEAGVATKVGQVRVTVTLKDGITIDNSAPVAGSDNYTVTVNIISRLNLQVQQGEQRTYVKGVVSEDSPALVYVTNPGNEPFDPNDLTIVFDNRFIEEGIPYAEQTEVVQMGTDEETGAKIYGFHILPKYVSENAGYVVNHQGEPIGDNDVITITQKQQLAKGWNWISVTSVTSPDGDDVSAVFTQADIVEMRSQSQILYNDPTYGYFGDLTHFTPSEAMYKVKTNKATTATWGSTAVLSKAMTGQAYAEISKGYNWINNPYEFDIPAARIDEFFGANFTPTDGDMIITLEGSFAQYSDGAWVASDNFALKEGKGLIYFSNAETAEQMTIDFNFDLAPQAEAAPVKGVRDLEDNMAADLFQYNPHAFADNMAMVATIEGLENPENYTLGVFVNDECRGRGQVVKDGILFVNAVGKVGEHLTFKLANNRTGEVTDLEDTMTYSLIKGSLKAPVQLSGTTVTGIAKTMDEAQDEAIYDMSGRRVEKMQKGIYIVGGKKVLKK